MNSDPTPQFPRLHRALHWVTAAAMLVLFSTGFLRMEWMSKGAMLEAAKLQKLEATQEQIIGVYKLLREPMWKWHVYAAYVMALCVTARLIYMAARGMRFPNPFLRKNSMKERLQGSIYLLFYLFVVEAVITGFYLKWVGGSWKPAFEAAHKWGIYIFPAFIAAHVVGIWLAERKEKRGIVSKMIGGDAPL